MLSVATRGQLKCHGTRAETTFRLSAKRTSPFKSAGASVQSTTGSRGVRISCSNVGYIMFRGSVKGIGYPIHSPVSPSLPLPSVTMCHHISTGVYYMCIVGISWMKWVRDIGVMLKRKSRSGKGVRGRQFSVSLILLQIPLWLTWDETRSSVVRSRWLTSWGIASALSQVMPLVKWSLFIPRIVKKYMHTVQWHAPSRVRNAIMHVPTWAEFREECLHWTL